MSVCGILFFTVCPGVWTAALWVAGAGGCLGVCLVLVGFFSRAPGGFRFTVGFVSWHKDAAKPDCSGVKWPESVWGDWR